MNLSILSQADLAQIDAAFGLMLNALDLLQERGIISEGQAVNLTELYDAVNAEQEHRSIERARNVILAQVYDRIGTKEQTQ